MVMSDIKKVLRLLLFLCVLFTISLAAERQKPAANQADKGCGCESRFKTCKRYAKKKDAVKACEEDRRKCKESCPQ
jgi:hypothetical protein